MTITLNGYQLKQALELVDDEDGTELCIDHVGHERQDSETGEIMPPGVYAWLLKYPEEGSTLLEETPEGSEQPRGMLNG